MPKINYAETPDDGYPLSITMNLVLVPHGAIIPAGTAFAIDWDDDYRGAASPGDLELDISGELESNTKDGGWKVRYNEFTAPVYVPHTQWGRVILPADDNEN